MIHSTRKTVVFSTVLLAFAGTAWAVDNLAPNPDFNSNTSGWTFYPGPGGLSLNTGDGDPAAPSMQLAATGNYGSSLVVSDCIPVSAGSAYAISTYVKATGSKTYMQVSQFGNTTCDNAGYITSSDVTITGPTNGWTSLSMGPVGMGSGVQGAQIQFIEQLDANGGNVTALFDHVNFELDEIFRDGFETSGP